MSRDAFLAALRFNLRGLPASAVEDIMADYASHFDEGAAAGRSEADIAAALGEPARLARELRAEAGLRRWDEERSPGAAAAAILAILSLGAIDLLVLLPILLVVFSLILALFAAAAGMIVAGLGLLISLPFGLGGEMAGNGVQAGLLSLACVAGGVSLASLMTLVVIGLSHLLIRYGRFHVRLVQPVST